MPTLLERLPRDPDADDLLDAFLDWATERDLELYPHQEEAILEIFAGHNVILNTPTGSGKSLVAFAAHVAAVARGHRSWYTAPIKALVSEKFFDLCHDLGSEHVGMITGDASVNPGAPVICCTAEILSGLALREGSHAAVDQVVMDEFHYYSDPQRGVAWQVPLLELPQAAFVLMSATLGDTRRFEVELTERTGRPTTLVRHATRPVPLDFAYRTTPIHESLDELLDTDRAPVYLVHFTQKAATEAAQSLMSLDVLTKDEKAAVKEAVGDFRFDSPIGKDLRRWIGHGIGVHHAGMLPKYRRLVERLAQDGLLKLICGTDTLGVGVNVPIRTVLFTQLCKYDGSETRILSVREFAQIAGRAGRRGFDDQGYVWVQAPAHWVENRRAEEKAATDAKKRKKLVKKKPPERGYAHWSEDTFHKLVGGEPEALTSSFRVTHQMLMQVLDRPGDGCAAARHLLTHNHEPRRQQRRHIRRAISIYRSLVDAEVIEELDEPDELGRLLRVTVDLQDEFSLNQPLSLFVLDAVEILDPGDDEYALDVVSVVESVLENPGVVLARQVDKARDALMAEMKADGVEYEQRMESLAEVTHPKPLAEPLYDLFDRFRTRHPWVGSENIRPKSVTRDLYERAMTFREYVNHYGLKRSEGVLLRYLSDTYKALVQNVPATARTEPVDVLIEWLGEVVRQVDSSLLEEWERLTHPDELLAAAASGETAPAEPERPDVTANTRAFGVMVRNEVFRWVTLLARHDHTALAESLAESPAASERRWRTDDLDEAMAPYWAEHDTIEIGADARSARHVTVDGTRVTQTLVDPEGWREWRLVAEIDLAASRDIGEAALALVAVERL